MDLPITRNEWVAARLREGILSGDLAPSARLNADALAERWNISPTPVRESFRGSQRAVSSISTRGVARASPSSRPRRWSSSI
jgi:DNA-binding GntR family transcriptional regulator